MNLCDIRTIKDTMAMFGLTFRKEFGQNFLTDREVVAEIAESCGGPNTKTVLEIGAGCGSLTHELALIYDNVVALEIDRGLIPLLKYTLGEHKNIKLINADVMKTDIPELLGDAFEQGGVSVCANLPYYITTPILLELLDSRLYLISLGCLVSEAFDELLIFFNHLLLIFEGSQLLSSAFCSQHNILAVRHFVVIGVPQQQLNRTIRNIIQKCTVVRDEHHGSVIILQVILQPLNTLDIEVVCRLVEQQYGRSAQKNF